MRTKTQTQNVAGGHASGQPSDTPELALIAILVAMVLLRILDVTSPSAPVNSGCTPTKANRAIISCAVRGDQNWDDAQSVASLTGRR